MPTLHPQSIKDFASLLKYLKEELDWDVEASDPADYSFTYTPEELGIDPKYSVGIAEAFQIRTFDETLPVFWFKFKNKRLPIVVLRRILRAFVAKKRPGANPSTRKTYERPDDLFFICALGEENNRGLTLAHFRPLEDEHLAQLRTFGWDGQETHFHHLEKHLQELKWDNRDDWSRAFIAEHGRAIKDSRELAVALAEFAREIRAYTLSLYEVEVADGALHALHKNFGALLGSTTPEQFADAVAQTVTSALLAVRFEGHTLENVALTEIQHKIPFTNPFLTEFIEHLARIGFSSEQGVDFDDLGIEDLKAFLNAVDMQAIREKFGATARGGAEDPVLYFYEDFLKAYDSAQKVKRGVFYTPKPVVDFIVRGVDHLVREELGFPLGLADASQDKDGNYHVTILDPAGGTGTFFVSIIELVHATMCAEWKKQGKRASEYSGLWDAYVSRDLLPRLFGFELMMAPYTIAHLKIGLKLSEFGYVPKPNERVNFFLTNTLEQSQQLALDLPGFLSKEASEAARVKGKTRVTVVVGNPPYSSISSNMSKHLDDLLKKKLPSGTSSYYEIDGQPLGERKVWLQDDYVKFIRYSQAILDRAPFGVLGFITNHGYFDNPTFRGMRQSLTQTFDDIRVLDLHGNTLKKEKAPDGGKDENVFDIQQGVGIGLFVRHSERDQTRVLHADLWGERNEKYEKLQKGMTAPFEPLLPNSPNYFFARKNETGRGEYELGMNVPEIFPVNSTGIVTSRDSFVTDFSDKPLLARIKKFADLNLTDQAVQKEFDLSENYAWRVSAARRELATVKDLSAILTNVLYRPFDIRRIAYHPSIVFRTRTEVMRHMNTRENLGLATARSNKSRDMNHFFCSRHVMETKCAESTTQSALFPLYLYNPPINWDTQLLGTGQDGRRANLAPAFVARLGTLLKLQWISDGRGDGSTRFGPEDVLSYIYAIFHAPSYRSRYAEFLKIDFPRVPLTDDAALFWQLVEQGRELIGLHLLDGISDGGGSTPRGEVAAGYPKYENGKVVINKAGDGFDGISEEVWNFHIGGYQVAYKWLKDRKGRTLSVEDAGHYRKVLVALERTIAAMKDVDAVIAQHGNWPLPGSQAASILNAEDVKSFFGIRGELKPPARPTPKKATSKQAAPKQPAPKVKPQSPRQPIPTRQTSARSTPAPAELQEWLVLIRGAFQEKLNFSRDELVREVAVRAGYNRVGAKVTDTINTAIRTAVRRGILNHVAGRFYLPRRTIADYKQDEVVAALVAAMGRTWIEREEAMRATTSYLGFARTGSNIRSALKSAIRGAILRKLIEYDGDWIRRTSSK